MNIKIALFIVALILTSIVTTLIYRHTQQADINYYQGHRLFENGKFAQAIEFYEKALIVKPSPRDNKIKESLAQSLSWQKEYDKAIQLYKEVIAKTDSLDTKMQLAEVYIWNNQFEEAKEILFEILKITPQDKKAKLLLARAMQYSGQAEQAIEIYKELLREVNGNE